MKLTRQDLRKLQWQALLALCLLLAASALVGTSQASARQAKLERDVAASQTQQIEQQLSQVRGEEQEIKERITQFQEIERSGMTGDEKRLDWIELLRELQQQLRLPGMHYEFGPQVSMESVSWATYAYHSSHLRIQFQLLHEEDLLNFVQQLQQRAGALVLLRGCRLTRLVSDAESNAGLSQLNAECAMEWVSLRRSGAAKQA